MARTDAPDVREITYWEDLASRLDRAVEAVCVSRRLTRGQVADAIGVKQNRLSNWTGRHDRPSLYYLVRFCQKFSVPAEWLFLGEDTLLPKFLAAYLEQGEAGTAEASMEPARPRRGRKKQES